MKKQKELSTRLNRTFLLVFESAQTWSWRNLKKIFLIDYRPWKCLYQFSSSLGSIPLGFQMDPSHSMIPMQVAPALQRYLIVCRPTLPKPWTMKVLPAQPGVTPIMAMYWASLTKLSRPWKTPRPVAEVRLKINRYKIVFFYQLTN